MTAARVVVSEPPDPRAAAEAVARAARVRERLAGEARRRAWAERGKGGPSWWAERQAKHGEDRA